MARADGGKTSEQDNNGFILISVLWFVALISIAAAAFAVSSRHNNLTLANQINYQASSALANGLAQSFAVLLIANRKLSANLGKGFDANRWRTCSLKKKTFIAVKIQDQSGLIDINTAAPKLLELTLRKTGIAPSEVTKVFYNILDFRDRDDVGRSGGQENQPIGSGHTVQRAKNAPFQSIDELEQVSGVSPLLFEKIAPMLTVNNLTQGFNPKVAPDGLLRLLGINKKNSAKTTGANAQYFITAKEQTLKLSVVVFRNEKTWFQRSVIFSLRQNLDRKLRFIDWNSTINIRQKGQLQRSFARAKPCFFNN